MFDITDPIPQEIKDTFHRWVDDGLPFDALPLAVQDRYRFLPPDADWSDITFGFSDPDNALDELYGFSDNALAELEAHKRPAAEAEYQQWLASEEYQLIARESEALVALGFAPPPNRID